MSGTNKLIRFTCTLFVIFWVLATAAFCADIKAPNVAGSFYPADAQELSSLVDNLLKTTQVQKTSGDIRLLISPHAGYEYSARVAAYGYSLIRDKEYDTVIIIAPSHNLYFEGVAIWPKGSFRTPLGDIAVDADFCKRLPGLGFNLKRIPEAFLREHALEVQLPFLQRALKGFKIVPLITGKLNFSDYQLLAHSLSLLTKDMKCLLVASTDLSHYHSYEEANKIDKLTISYIKNLDAQGLYNQSLSGNIEACGISAVITGILYAKELGLSGVSILKYANSGDVTGDYDRVVGYLSAAIYKEEESSLKKGEGNMLDAKQKKRLLDIARDSIATYLKTGEKLELSEKDSVLLEECGAFVTLHERGELRGCIGNLIGRGPLYLTVRDMAVESAVGDPRFIPLKLSGLASVEIEISVLSPMQRVNSSDEIKLGAHGVLVKNGLKSGVFLPQVATETGWSKEEFLSTLCVQKAGLAPSAWKDKDTELYIFTAEVFSEKEL
ncbi:MAG: AmmeMemoRadiSam system protein B [bacterium]